MISIFRIFESYLKSNFAPLYHFTTLLTLSEILDDNVLKVGYYDNPFFGKISNFVSLTRNDKFKFKFRKVDCRMKLDRNLLRSNYKIIPYDFFIQSNTEIYPKSDIKRTSYFEFEEVVSDNITNLNNYLISIDFYSIEDIFRIYKVLSSYVKRFDTEITLNGKKINIFEL